jgi:hypothetical protein
LLELFGKALKQGSQLLLYKGPEVDAELQEAQQCRVEAGVVCKYTLPDDMGARTLLRIRAPGSVKRNAVG